MMFTSLAGWALGIHLYFLFMTASLVGVILFVVWAARLETKKLRKWVIWLFAVGVIGCLLTFQYGWPFVGGIKSMMGDGRGGMMGNQFWNNNQPQ